MLIKDWMTKDPITITEDTSMIKAIHIMKEHRFRRFRWWPRGSWWAWSPTGT